MEFGLNGSAVGVPAAKLDVEDDRVMETMAGLQVALVGFAVLHAVLVA
jgi:hypothetical protein